MKAKFLFALFLLINGWVLSQYRCPINSRTIVLFKPRPNFSPYGHPGETRDRIQSKNNQVINVFKGNVVKIIQSDSDYSIIIRNDKDDFFIYSNLSKTVLKVNDTVEKDQLLGLANYDEYFAYYVLDFQFWKKDESIKVDLNCTKPD